MAQFIECVAGDVLGTIAIEVLQGELVRILIAVGHSAQLRILLPKIGFNQFCCRQKLKDRSISAS